MSDKEITHPTPTELRIDGPVVEILEQVKKWQEHGISQLQNLQEHGNPGVVIKLGSTADGEELDLELNEDSAKGFRVALLVAMSQFGVLPFTMTPNEEPANAEPSEEPV